MADELRSFNLNRPEATGKDEYLYLWQTYEINLSHLICSSDVKFDPRIPRMVRFMISLIAHDAIRHTAEDNFDSAIAYANSRKDLPLDERNDMILRICATMSGSLTSYVDQFKGLAHQLKVGELVDLNKQYYKDGMSGECADGLLDANLDGVRVNKDHIMPMHIPMVPAFSDEFDEEPGFVSAYDDPDPEDINAPEEMPSL